MLVAKGYPIARIIYHVDIISSVDLKLYTVHIFKQKRQYKITFNFNNTKPKVKINL